MGMRFRKSINFGGARINFSKSGIGASVGGKGFRVTKKAGGGTRTTASIPGTGLSYQKDSKKKSQAKSAVSAVPAVEITDEMVQDLMTSDKALRAWEITGYACGAFLIPSGLLIGMIAPAGFWCAGIGVVSILAAKEMKRRRKVQSKKIGQRETTDT